MTSRSLPEDPDDRLRQRLAAEAAGWVDGGRLAPADPELQARLARIEALALKDWTQWRREGLSPTARRPAVAVEAVASTGSVNSWGSTGPSGRRGWWPMAATSMLVFALVVALWWANRPDPAMDELMRLDLLSLIAAGEI